VVSYTLASRFQKPKARSNPYMVIFHFIGYFIPVYLCYAVSTSLLLSQDSGLDCFLLIFLSATLPPRMSAQLAGLIGLMQALKISEGKRD
jgi:hypothetical protein